MCGYVLFRWKWSIAPAHYAAGYLTVHVVSAVMIPIEQFLQIWSDLSKIVVRPDFLNLVYAKQ